MPVHGRPFEKGNLYVRFNVQFPTSLSPSSRTQLANLLPGGSASNGTMDMDEAEHVRLCRAILACCRAQQTRACCLSCGDVHSAVACSKLQHTRSWTSSVARSNKCAARGARRPASFRWLQGSRQDAMLIVQVGLQPVW